MTVLGDRLRQAREAKGLSVQAVSGVTKIREHILIALETESFEELPAPVFVRGFLRTLARHLKLNADELLALYAEAVPQEPSLESAPVVEEKPRPGELSAPTIRGPGWPGWLNPGSVMVGLIAIVLVAGIVWGGSQIAKGVSLPSFPMPPFFDAPTPASSASSVRVTPVAPSPAPALSAAPTAALAAPSPAATFAFPTPTATAAASFEVRLDVVSRSWVKVEVDGTGVQESVLEVGVSKTYMAARRVTLRVGNAAGISVTVNGKAQPALGAEGDVVDRQWTIGDGGAVVLVTPTWTNPPSTSTATPVATAPVPSPTR